MGVVLERLRGLKDSCQPAELGVAWELGPRGVDSGDSGCGMSILRVFARSTSRNDKSSQNELMHTNRHMYTCDHETHGI